VRLALERRREQNGDVPPVALALSAQVQARDAPVQPHALETYDQLKELRRLRFSGQWDKLRTDRSKEA
jgi:hypothetical protein